MVNKAEDAVVSGKICRRSVILTPEMDAEVMEIVDESGEGVASVFRTLIRLGLQARSQGAKVSDEVALKKPLADYLKQMALDLDADPETLLRQIVTEGLAARSEQAQNYLAKKLALQQAMTRQAQAGEGEKDKVTSVENRQPRPGDK